MSRPKLRTLPAIALLKPRNCAQKRRLAATGGAQNSDKLAGGDGEIDSIENNGPPIAGPQLLDFNGREVPALHPTPLFERRRLYSQPMTATIHCREHRRGFKSCHSDQIQSLGSVSSPVAQ